MPPLGNVRIQNIAAPVLKYHGKSKKKYISKLCFYSQPFLLEKHSFVSIIKVWINKCSGFVIWCHLMLIQRGKHYIKALVRHIAGDVKCVCLKTFWLCTCFLKLVLQTSKYLQFTPSAEKTQGLFNGPLKVQNVFFLCCCKLQQVLKLTNPENCRISI